MVIDTSSHRVLLGQPGAERFSHALNDAPSLARPCSKPRLIVPRRGTRSGSAPPVRDFAASAMAATQLDSTSEIAFPTGWPKRRATRFCFKAKTFPKRIS